LGYITQVEEHPSLFAVLLSSQFVAPASTKPSPHIDVHSYGFTELL